VRHRAHLCPTSKHAPPPSSPPPPPVHTASLTRSLLSGNCAEEDKVASKESGQDWRWEKPLPRSEELLQDIARVWNAAKLWGERAGRGGLHTMSHG